MNVMLIETLGDGGIAHYTYNLANALVKKGEDVILFTTRRYEFSTENCRYRLYPRMFRLADRLINCFPSLDSETGFFKYLRRTIKLLEYPLNVVDAVLIAKKEKIDVIHLQSVNETELLMVSALAFTGAKIVYTVHNVIPRHGRLRLYHRIIYRFIFFMCNHIIVHTESGKREIMALFGVKPGKISVIPHGDYKFFVPSGILSKVNSKELLGIPMDSRVMLFFGAIRPNKGLDRLLYALSHIKKIVPNIKLMIVGEPCEDFSRYRSIIREESIEDIIFEKLEYVINKMVSIYFMACDLVVLPYYEVTGSGVLQIAYAFGKPVVATDVPGFREAIIESKNGYLVSPNDIAELATRIIDILKDDEKAYKMGKYSKYLSDTIYSWDSIATSTLKLYCQI